MRPRSLAAVADHVRGGHPLPAAMSEFEDALIFHVRACGWDGGGRMPITPDWLAERPETSDPVLFAFLCGLAEYLADHAELPAPAWSDAGFLEKATLLGADGPRSAVWHIANTPCAFARRTLYVGAVFQKMWALLDNDF